MADIIDSASEIEELQRNTAIKMRRLNHQAISATHCCECGDPIDERRRLAVQGCRTCASCGEEIELRTNNGDCDGLKAANFNIVQLRCKMFRIIFPNTWYVDHHGTPCKILRSTHNKVHYIRKGRTCIASMFRFNHDFEPVNKADADRIAEEIETAEHIKKLRAIRRK